MAVAVTKAGVPVTHVSVRRYESGERSPRVDYLLTVADLAGVDPHWLLTGGDAEADETKPALQVEGRVSALAIGDAERLDLLRMLTDVQAALVRGPEPAILPTADPEVRREGADDDQRDVG